MSRARPFAFNNARLVDPETGYDGPGAVVVSGGVIADIARGRDFTDLSSDVRVIDCNVGMLAPGLVTLAVDNQGTVDCIQSIIRGARGYGRARTGRRHGAGVRAAVARIIRDKGPGAVSALN
jgi:N-acetylglucosamine-6-phosphate deacetylase